MERRTFLTGSMSAAGAAALAGAPSTAHASADTSAHASAPPSPAGPAAAPHPHYTANRAPLRPEPFLRLPPGSITPRGWLRAQLDLQLDGLNGRMPEVSDYLDERTSGWSVPDHDGWEELPYWLRGFGDLGYVTQDSRVLETTRAWIDRILATRQPDGFFGPARLRTALGGGPDFWPYMPVLDALRTWHEYSGDDRVVPALTGWLKYLHTQPGTLFGQGWGAARVGDTIDTAYWLYNRTGEDWLLDLVRTLHTHSADYTHTIPTWHNVNLAQGFREPAQYGVLAGDDSFLRATHRVYDTVMARYGQFPGGGFAADENARPGYHDPRQGFETCGIVEFMHSHQLLARITGDTVWADRCEDLALNMLPAAFDPRQKGTHYVTAANSVQLDNVAKSHGQFDNGFAMQAYRPGVHDYRCCPHNYGMGWPYYAEEMWLASLDGGLCASLYGESTVRAKVGDGTTVTVTEQTGYPFDETVTLTVSAPHAVTFPLHLRVPGWCHEPSVRLAGLCPSGAAAATSSWTGAGTTATGSCCGCPCAPGCAPGTAAPTPSPSTTARSPTPCASRRSGAAPAAATPGRSTRYAPARPGTTPWSWTPATPPGPSPWNAPAPAPPTPSPTPVPPCSCGPKGAAWTAGRTTTRTSWPRSSRVPPAPPGPSNTSPWSRPPPPGCASPPSRPPPPGAGPINGPPSPPPSAASTARRPCS